MNLDNNSDFSFFKKRPTRKVQRKNLRHNKKIVQSGGRKLIDLYQLTGDTPATLTKSEVGSIAGQIIHLRKGSTIVNIILKLLNKNKDNKIVGGTDDTRATSAKTKLKAALDVGAGGGGLDLTGEGDRVKVVNAIIQVLNGGNAVDLPGGTANDKATDAKKKLKDLLGVGAGGVAFDADAQVENIINAILKYLNKSVDAPNADDESVGNGNAKVKSNNAISKLMKLLGVTKKIDDINNNIDATVITAIENNKSNVLAKLGLKDTINDKPGSYLKTLLNTQDAADAIKNNLDVDDKIKAYLGKSDSKDALEALGLLNGVSAGDNFKNIAKAYLATDDALKDLKLTNVSGDKPGTKLDALLKTPEAAKAIKNNLDVDDKIKAYLKKDDALTDLGIIVGNVNKTTPGAKLKPILESKFGGEAINNGIKKYIDDTNKLNRQLAFRTMIGVAANGKVTMAKADIIAELNNVGVNNLDPVKVFNVNTIDGSLLKDDTVTEAKIDNNAVTEAKIDNNAVTADKIKNGAVIAAKIDNSAVTTNKIADDAVTEAKIDNDAVTTNKIKNGEVTAAKLQGTILTDASLLNPAKLSGVVPVAKLPNIPKGKIKGSVVDAIKDSASANANKATILFDILKPKILANIAGRIGKSGMSAEQANELMKKIEQPRMQKIIERTIVKNIGNKVENIQEENATQSRNIDTIVNTLIRLINRLQTRQRV